MRTQTWAYCALSVFTFANYATAQSPSGTWTLYPPQVTGYTTAVQQPINADGTSNFKSTGKSVIPVKFSLATGSGPVVFQSIGSDADTSNDYSYLSFAPSAALTFNQITTLSAVYTFTEGNCHGGSLRWSVGTAVGHVFIYYGAYPNFTDCTTTGDTTINQSGINMIGQPDLRYDTSQIPGGTQYDNYAHAQTLVGTLPITGATLVLDSGWGGDQVVAPMNVTVNTNTFVPATGSTPTCTLPPATIKIDKLSGSTTGPVNEPLTVQPADDNSQFRIAGCAYMYSLDTSSLSGAGRYEVDVVINGTPVATSPALFDLR